MQVSLPAQGSLQLGQLIGKHEGQRHMGGDSDVVGREASVELQGAFLCESLHHESISVHCEGAAPFSGIESKSVAYGQAMHVSC